MKVINPLFMDELREEFEKAKNIGIDFFPIITITTLYHQFTGFSCHFDYIMNSQALWGCFETVKGLRIAELHRPENSQVVSVIRYTWNGHERILDEQ